MKGSFEDRYCETHGRTPFKHKQNAKGDWWVCYECLKTQWKISQAKRRLIPEVREYQRQFNQDKGQLIKSLSLVLRLLVLANLLKPE